MLKAKMTTNDGPLVVLGLSDANVRELKKDNPIVFCLSELQLEKTNVMITYGHDDGTAAKPAKYIEIGLAIVLTNKVIDQLLKEPIENKIHGINFMIFRGKDEKTMGNNLSSLIGVNTKTRHKGFAPSDLPPSMN